MQSLWDATATPAFTLPELKGPVRAAICRRETTGACVPTGEVSFAPQAAAAAALRERIGGRGLRVEVDPVSL